MTTETTRLYRYRSAEGQILYIGITAVRRGTARQRDHERSVWWPYVASATFEDFATREEALAAEATAIRYEQPPFNQIQPNADGGAVPLPPKVVDLKSLGKGALSRKQHRQIAGSYGGFLSWSKTVDRTARTAPARRNGPGGIDFHLRRLGPEFDGATEHQRVLAAEAARSAYFKAMAARSAIARRAS